MRSPTRILSIFILLATAAGAGGCSALYVLKQGYGQLKVITGRIPVEQALGEERRTEQQKSRLRLAIEAREYAEKTIGLTRSDNYTTVYDTGGKPVSWNLSAAPKDRLQPKTWWFPVVGTIPYLGFFNADDARAAERDLIARDYDTCLRPVSAYSTLGWFSDPIFSPMLDYSEHDLANVIIHELTHGTVFVRSQVDFNESFATFVGNQGSYDFLVGKYGPDAPQPKSASDERADGTVFGIFLAGRLKTLGEMYTSGLPRAEKLVARESLFREMQEAFVREIQPELRTGSYAGFARQRLNNAVLLGEARYMQDLELYEQVHARRGGTLKETVALVVRLTRENGSRDPKETLKAWLEDPDRFPEKKPGRGPSTGARRSLSGR